MAREGDVIYEIRGDDSNLERDLDAAQKKVEQSARKSGERTEQIERETSETVRECREDVTAHHEQQNDEIVRDDEETGKQREDTERNTGEKLKSIAGGTAKAIGAGMLAVGTAAVAVGGLAVNSATQMDQAMNQFLSSTGKSVEETEKYQKVLENIYTNNYGDSFEDIADSMAVMQQQMGYIEDDELQGLVESAYALRDTFGYEVTESARAASTMMTQFGISGEEAMSLIAAGAQNGLDYSGELIDSINEYSVQFAKVGLDADDMFKIFQQGAASGAWNLDKIGDAVKEFSIRAIDGSDSTAEGFEKIGLNADKMAAKFAAGGDTAKAAFQETIRGLASIEDPLEQNIAGTDLFGTMWEDLGPEAVAALAEIEDGAYDTADAMNQIKETKYNDLGSMFEGLKRSVEMLLLPLGEQLIPVLDDLIEAALPVIEEVLPPLIELFGGLLEQMMPVAEEILPVMLDLFNELVPPLMSMIEEILPIFMQLFSEILPVLTQIAQAVLPILVQLFEKLLPPLMQLVSALLPPLVAVFEALLPPVLELVQALLPVLIDLINGVVTVGQALTPIIEVLAKAIGSVLAEQIKSIQPIIDALKATFQALIDFVAGVFTGDWERAWKGITGLFKANINMIPAILETVINNAIRLLNKLISGINAISSKVGITAIPEIKEVSLPRLKTGIDFVPSDYFPAYLDYGERVLTQSENARFNALGGLEGIEMSLSAAGAYDKEQKIVLGKGCIVVQSNIDGKTAAQTMAPYMDTELGDVKNVDGRNAP